MKILILAGGKSKRMGRNKALIERPDGTRQIDHILGLARQFSSEVLISTNSPEIATDDIPILPDLNPGDGPLGALASFHADYPTDSVLLLGCDLFLLDGDTIRSLIDDHDPAFDATAYPNRIDGKPEPLCAIFEPSAIAKAQDSIGEGNYCVRHFLGTLNSKTLNLPNPVALDNANSPADLEEAFSKIKFGVHSISVKVLYFAKLREERGLDEESVVTLARTAAGLYDELSFRHRFTLKLEILRCALNGDFCDWNQTITNGDEIVFIPPVAGG